jgi:gluconolactonase
VVDPLVGIGTPALVGSGYSFLEGPHWRTATSELYFCDVSTSRIYALTPPSTINLHRTGTGAASGLATDVNGDLLAVEWSGHRLSREDGMGVVSTVVSQYLGSTFNSPNDLTVRSDGTIYFTDPPVGGAPPGPPIGFNGLFRYTPGGTLLAEWMGGGSTRPNGVILSPDEQVLVATDWAAGTVLAWDVAVDGSLSGMRLFASGLPSADGLAVDIVGNLYVARSGGISVLSPGGDPWGFVSVPGGASNCAFGGTDGRTLYVTAGGNLYALSMVIPGHF